MSAAADIWAVLPVKHTADAKQRLRDALTPELRRRLADWDGYIDYQISRKPL